MAIPILKNWQNFFRENPNEGLGSSYERIILNQKLEEIMEDNNSESILEVPSFGFTGISGINSMGLAKSGKSVTVLDHDQKRLELIKQVWAKTDIKGNFNYQQNFDKLNFSNNSFDMSWNFSALWFVNNLNNFLSELTRTTRNAILICVPNRNGLGYLSQKYISGADLKEQLNERYIIPKNIISTMNKLDWKLVEWDYIDCPPWPDIGMEKEKFLEIFHLDFLMKLKKDSSEKKENLCILDFYRDEKPQFDQKMLKYAWLEKIAPHVIKFFWAHHKYFLFKPA